MDIFVEQLVKKHRTMGENCLIALIIILTILISFVVLFILPGILPVLSFFGILIVAGVVFGAYKLISRFSIEYEYAVTNGDITIDEIFAKKSRKRVISLASEECSEMGKYSREKHEQKAYSEIIDVSKDNTQDDNWYMIISNKLLIFSPDERTLTAIKAFLKPSVQKKTFGKVTVKY